MPLSFSYEPPATDARVALAAAAELAVESAGKTLLDASQQLVPVDTGALKASGQVTGDGPHTVAVSYGRQDGAGRNGADTADYAVIQHEALDYNHPNGGQAKYLEQAMHSAAPEILAAMAEQLRAALG